MPATGIIVPSLACFHFYWQFNTLLSIWIVLSETSWVCSCINIGISQETCLGCKILGDLCQPGRFEVCTAKDQEDTDKKYISKACYPKFLQKLSSHPWATHKNVYVRCIYVLIQGRKDKTPFCLNQYMNTTCKTLAKLQSLQRAETADEENRFHWAWVLLTVWISVLLHVWTFLQHFLLSQ